MTKRRKFQNERSSGEPYGCLVITKDTGRSERCKNCQRLWNNSLRFKTNTKHSTLNDTQASSRVKLSLLTNAKLLERARNMSKEIKKTEGEKLEYEKPSTLYERENK